MNNCRIARKFGLGFSLVELLVVVSIFTILAAAAGPSFNNMISNKALNTATQTLIQSVKKAKKIAQAERTFVDITLEDNVITLEKLNTASQQIVTLPGRISVQSDLKFRIDSIGNVSLFSPITATTPGSIILVPTDIILESTSNGASKTVSVSPVGHVSS